MTPRVTGRVVIGTSLPRFAAGVLHVQLEDVSYADAPATVVASIDVADIAHDPAKVGESTPEERGTVVPFSLQPADGIAPDRDYTVRARLDRGGDRAPGADTIWSDRTYPVLTKGFGSDVTIVLGT